ncbi:hypothetical protein G5714_016851 [Onychostoma macrolepis]|uniref:BEN domain-containing protein n=1 Tax=Onychostoma macrolepis TaxID=369639 RepID=A0A7J6C4T1_9TELE|nr:hypothetical protein G5714_016851 [Onychostoma macrolepis]
MWALIEWTEIEASLDIVKRKDILQSVVHEGDVVDVKYEDESSPALILKMNGQATEAPKSDGVRAKAKEECKLPEKRAIKRKIIFSPENTPSSSPDQVQIKRFKKVEKTQNDTLLLKKIEEKNKENYTLNDLRNEIKALRAENQQLKALNFKLQNEIINRFAELLPNRSANKHAVQTSLTSAACSAALQPANSSHLSSSGLDHVEIHKKLNMAKDTFQACGRGGTSWSAMIKDLAVAVFGRSMLATHSLSGKIGNANKESQAKPPLDPTKVELIIDTVSKKFPETPRKFLRLLYGKIE